MGKLKADRAGEVILSAQQPNRDDFSSASFEREGIAARPPQNHVVVVPVTQTGRIVTLRTYSPALERESLVFADGAIAPRERPVAAAIRHLSDKMGYIAPSWHLIGAYRGDDVQSTGDTYYVICHGAQLVTPRLSAQDDAGTVELHTPDALRTAMQSGDLVLLRHVTAFALSLMTS